MAITDWPESERPREKLLQKGAAALSDAEFLAIFLRTGVVGKRAKGVRFGLLWQPSIYVRRFFDMARLIRYNEALS